jgi:hypothetical protein
MHHPPKRYTSEEQIIKDIDRAKKRVTRLINRSVKTDSKATELFMSGVAGDDEKAKILRDQAQQDRDKAERINKTRLMRPQNTLASFRTEILPGMVTDNAVVLQRK